MTSKAVEATWDISHYRQLRGELVHGSKLLLMQKTKRKTGTGIVYTTSCVEQMIATWLASLYC